MASELVGRVLQGVGGVAVAHAESTIDEARQVRLEKLRQSGRSAERAEEREYQTGVRAGEQEHQATVRAGEQEFQTSEREAGEKSKMALKKAEIAGKSTRNTLKSSTKLEDGTVLFSYRDGTAEILDPSTGARTPFGTMGDAKAEIKTRDSARQEAEEMFDKINDGPLWFDKLDLAKFQDNEDVAKAKIADMIIAGASDSEIMKVMLAPDEAPIDGDTAANTTVATSPTLATDQKQPAGMPDPVQHSGRIVKDKSTGKRYKSDGASWVEQ